MVGAAPGAEVSKKDIEQATEFKISTWIPHMPKVFLKAENEGKDFASMTEGQDIIKRLRPLLQGYCDDTKPSTKSNFIDGLVQKIKGS